LYAASYVLHKRQQVGADWLSKALYEAAKGEHQAAVELFLADFGVGANAEGSE
jgi:hypothetical protein